MRYKLKNLDKLLTQLADMSNAFYFDEAVKKAINEGSDYVADETRKALQDVKVDNRPFVPGKREGILQVQKDALLRGFGISPIQEGKRDSLNRKTGVDRNVNKLDQPNVVIARRLENGTSYMEKNPVFSKASRKARSECLKIMSKSLTKSINNIWNRH